MGEKIYLRGINGPNSYVEILQMRDNCYIEKIFINKKLFSVDRIYTNMICPTGTIEKYIKMGIIDNDNNSDITIIPHKY